MGNGDRVSDGTESEYRNADIRIEDCTFGCQAGTLEMLALFNVQRIQVVGCDFNNQTGGPAIGLYQNVSVVKIRGCTFEEISGQAIYYSLSTNYISVI